MMRYRGFPLPALVLLVLALACPATMAGIGTAGADEAPAALVREARLPATGAQRLMQLAAHADWRVRKSVASNRRAPVAVLRKLAADPESQVRISVATNLSTPADVYLQLARDKDEAVRSVVARFEYVPAEALRLLAADAVPRIRLEVARNWNTDVPTLEMLARDSDPDIASVALQSLQKRREEAAGQNP